LFHIIHVGKLLQRRVESAIRSEFQISKSDAELLIITSSNPQASQTWLAQMLSVSAPAVSRQIDKLEKQELLIREVDPNSRRSSIISLTDKGQKLQGEVIKRFKETLDEIAQNNMVISPSTHKELLLFEENLENRDKEAQDIRLQITHT